MEINSISGVNNFSMLREVEGISEPALKTDKSFDSYLINELNNVNNNIVNAETKLSDLATGKTSNIHEVLLSIEEAKLSFQMIMQVRNKVLESVQEVLRMQV